MPEKNPVQETLDIILGQLKDLDRQAAEKKRTANDLCRVLERPPIFQDIEATALGVSTRPDEYYGRQAPDVIRTVLEKRKQANQGAATVTEIYEAMIAGGYSFQTANDAHAKRGVYSILASDDTFHKLPGGRIGLAVWYPTVKAKAQQGEGARRKPHRKTGRLRKSRDNSHPKKERQGAEEPKQAEESEKQTQFARGELLILIRRMIPDLPEKFTILRVENALESNHPREYVRASIAGALRRMVENGELEIVQQGSGRRPTAYSVTKKRRED